MRICLKISPHSSSVVIVPPVLLSPSELAMPTSQLMIPPAEMRLAHGKEGLDSGTSAVSNMLSDSVRRKLLEKVQLRKKDGASSNEGGG